MGDDWDKAASYSKRQEERSWHLPVLVRNI